MSLIMHLDMNSYFASVEQQANPLYRGRPVAICAYLAPGGCIIAASIEAKRQGIKTGCRVSDALKLEPKLILLANEPDKYRATTARIFKILRDYSEVVEPYSIDEAFVDLTGYVADYASALSLVKTIKARIKAEVGDWLECSVGLSWTRFLAKFAGDLAPKAGVLVIDNHTTLDRLIKDRPLIEAWGIGTAWQARLNDLGIQTLDQLKAYDEHSLRQRYGRWAYYLWANLQGIELSKIHSEPILPKSIGHSYCLPRRPRRLTASDLDYRDYVRQVLFKLAEKVGRRLRASAQEAQAISINLAYRASGGLSGTYQTKTALYATEDIWRELESFLATHRIILPVAMAALSVTKLRAVSGQLDFFGQGLKSRHLSEALDKINDRYGEYTVIRGAMWGTELIAPDRIGFRKTILN